MPFSIVRQDITKLKVDAIVNAANPQLKQGGGVCGAIFKAAGAKSLQAACDKLSPIKTGDAVITPGFDLPAKFIIHTAGPVYQDGKSGEEALLRACYRNSLHLAQKHQCESIAFPLISSGIYGYPKDQALHIATTEVLSFLNEHEMDIYLAVFDKEAFAASRKLLNDVKSYVDEHYVDQRMMLERASRRLDDQFDLFDRVPQQSSAPVQWAKPSLNLKALINSLDESFSTSLLRLIDAKGLDDVTVYKRANLSRKLFSKIRTGKSYTPSKPTALALAIALELTLPETQDLLKRAGLALSKSNLFDVIIEFFIVNQIYDIHTINTALFDLDQALLGN